MSSKQIDEKIKSFLNNVDESSINILSEKDSFILRCHYCFSIPVINIDLSYDIPLIHSYCRCKEKKTYPINEFLEKYNKILLSNFFCKECDKKQNYNENQDDLDLIQSSKFKICLNCNFIYCEECGEKHQINNKGHKLVYLKNFDYICINDFINANSYCKDCQIDICENCRINKYSKHLNHHIIKYLDLIQPLELKKNIDKIQRKIQIKKENYYELKKNINKEDLNKISNIFFNNFEINSQLNLLLYCNYKLYTFQNEKKRYNYAGLNNIIQTSNFNFPAISKNFLEIKENFQKTFNLIYNFFKYDLIINSPIELIKEKKEYKLINTISSKKINQEYNISLNISVNCLLILKNNLIVSGKDDGFICIYDSNKFALIKENKSHNKKINYLIEINNEENKNIKICSCSDDKLIKFWNITFNNINDKQIESFELLHEIQTGHNKVINKIIEINNYSISSCSSDKTIYFWDKNSYNKINEIYCDNEIMNICKCANILIYGGPHSDLFFYDLDIKRNVGNISKFSCQSNNCLINIDNINFIYGGNNGMIYLIQIGTLNIKKKFKINSKIEAINLLKNGLIILIGDNKLIKRINIYKEEEIDSSKINSNDLFTSIVQLNNENYIAASNTLGKIEIFCLN